MPKTETLDAESTHAGISGLTSDAIARRRMLLKSLGKGSSVIAAAAIPMHTLAGTGTLAKTINGTRCTVSSMASGIHSKDTTTQECSGLTTSKFADPSTWPQVSSASKNSNSNSNNNKTYTVTCAGIPSFQDSSLYSSVFGTGSSRQLLNILTKDSSSDEAVWITALLNSIVCVSGITSSGVKNYPYTPAEVIAMCKAKPTAVAFFRSNLQNV